MDYKRPIASRARRSVALVLGGLCLLFTQMARADDALAADGMSSDAFSADAAFPDVKTEDSVRLSLTELRSYKIPDDFDLANARIAPTEDGRTLIAATTGLLSAAADDPEGLACTVLVADDQAARAISFRYQSEPTGCVDVIAHPGGGFFVRGTKLKLQIDQIVPATLGGFTARIDADGREVWALEDQRLVDAASVAEGGTGAFAGDYLGAHSHLAYSPETDRVLAFSDGELSVADSRQVTQAHMIDAETGELRVSGLTFGLQDTSNTVRAAIYRAPEDDFLLHFGSALDLENSFVTYNGRRRVDAFALAGQDWRDRPVRDITLSSDQTLYLLSLSSEQVDAQSEVTAVDAQGDLLWTASLEQNERGVDLGLAEKIWVLTDYIVLYYSGPNGVFLRTLDRQTGESLGAQSVSGFSPFGIVAIFEAAGGTARLLSLDLQSATMHEFRLEVGSDEPPQNDADTGVDALDSGTPNLTPSSGEGGGCAVCQARSVPPISSLGLAFGLFVFTIATRRRANRVHSGE